MEDRGLLGRKRSYKKHNNQQCAVCLRIITLRLINPKNSTLCLLCEDIENEDIGEDTRVVVNEFNKLYNNFALYFLGMGYSFTHNNHMLHESIPYYIIKKIVENNIASISDIFLPDFILNLKEDLIKNNATYSRVFYFGSFYVAFGNFIRLYGTYVPDSYEITANKILKIKRTKQFIPLLSESDYLLTKTYLYKRKEMFGEIRDLLIFLILTSAGLRLSELMKLNREDVSIAPDGKIATLNIINSKRGKSRIAYINQETVDVLLEYLAKRGDEQPSLFVGNGRIYKISENDVGPIHQFYVQNIFIGNIKLLLNKRITCHSLRRYFASNMIRNGCSIEKLSQMMGHSTITQTMRYVSMDADTVEEEYRSINEQISQSQNQNTEAV